MLFTSVIFLFRFLPGLLITYFISPRVIRNVVLLVASLGFYFWGEKQYTLVMLLSILVNYLGALFIKRFNYSKVVLLSFVLVNVSVLLYYKYFGFLMDQIIPYLDLNTSAIEASKGIHLPIGISFFTFQGISYIVDVYRKQAEPEVNPVNVGLYISLFPQLIAGPIVRYNTVMEQIKERSSNLNDFFYGGKRFVIGFVKKVILANSMGFIADGIMDQPVDELSTYYSWLGIVAYTLQIYFDFSAYSDMAIGLGRIFGFRFEENFNFPYKAKSLKDFWGRWHISLSSWFRDYLYIPLGGSRKGSIRTYVNLSIVFFVTGLWHGASWSFVFWGMFHGSFLIIEKVFPKFTQLKAPIILQHLYTLLVVMVAWVFFRVEDFSSAIEYVILMFSFEGLDSGFEFTLKNYQLLTLLIAIIFSINVKEIILDYIGKGSNRLLRVYGLVELPILLILLIFSITEIANETYNPFIYFRF